MSTLPPTEVGLNELTILKESATQNPTKFHGPHVRLAGSTELESTTSWLQTGLTSIPLQATTATSRLPSRTYLHGGGTLQEHTDSGNSEKRAENHNGIQSAQCLRKEFQRHTGF